MQPKKPKAEHDVEKEEIIEEAILKQVSGGENTCEDETGTDTCFDGNCWGDDDQDPDD